MDAIINPRKRTIVCGFAASGIRLAKKQNLVPTTYVSTPKPWTQTLAPCTLTPKPWTQTLAPRTLNPKPWTKTLIP